MECYQHPGTASTATCIACAKPICAECSETVAGHTMCRPCVAATQERLTAEDAAAPVGMAPPAAPAPTPSPAPYADATAISEQPAAPAAAPTAQAYQAPVEPCGFAQYVKAIFFALIAGVVGAFIWDKFVYYTHIQFGLIAVLVAVLVGMAVRVGAEGRPGVLLPWIGALIAGFSMILGYALLAQDEIGRQGSQEMKGFLSLPWIIRMPILFFGTFRILDIMDWVFVAIGVYEGWSIPHKLNKEAEAA